MYHVLQLVSTKQDQDWAWYKQRFCPQHGGIHYRSESNNHTMECGGMILLFFHSGYLRLRISFGVDDYLVELILTGTLGIDQFMQNILPRERRIVPVHSELVPVLSAYVLPLKLLTTVDKIKYAVAVGPVCYRVLRCRTSRHSAEHVNNGSSENVATQSILFLATPKRKKVV